MSTLTIRTNNAPRDVVYFWELTTKEQAEFDYLDTEDAQSSASFFRYKGNVYDLGEFMRCPTSDASNPQMRDAGFHTWDGYSNDSFFSGIVVRYVQDNERVIVGQFFS